MGVAGRRRPLSESQLYDPWVLLSPNNSYDPTIPVYNEPQESRYIILPLSS